MPIENSSAADNAAAALNRGGLTTHAAAAQIEALLDPPKPAPRQQPKPEPREEVAAEVPEGEEHREDPAKPDKPADDDSQQGDEGPDADAGDGEENDEPIYAVHIDGKEVEVPLSELVKGYHRQSDYTRKTMALAETRKAAESAAAQALQEREAISQHLQVLKAALAQFTPQEPDWERIAREAPDRYLELRAQHDMHTRKLRAVQAAEVENAQRIEAYRGEQLRNMLQEQHNKLLESVPELKTPEKRKEFKEKVVTYAKAQGFTDQDLSNVTDHRALLVLHKAALYDETMAKASRLVEKRADVRPQIRDAAPGAAVPSNRATSEITRAKQRLAKTGKVNDAASLIERMLDKKPRSGARR